MTHMTIYTHRHLPIMREEEVKLKKVVQSSSIVKTTGGGLDLQLIAQCHSATRSVPPGHQKERRAL